VKGVADERVLVTWDAEERLFSVGALALRYDEDGLLVEITHEDLTQQLIEYDAKGIPTALTHLSQGVELSASSWDQTNEYDELGQLISTSRTYRADDAGTEHTRFSYDIAARYGAPGGPPTVITRELVSPLATTSIRYDFGYDYRDNAVFFEATQDGMITDRYLPAYFQVGSAWVLVSSQWDNGRLSEGVDGRIDVHESWFPEDHGHTISHDVDFKGPEPYPAPLDGLPDVQYVYTEAEDRTDNLERCASIAVSRYYLYKEPMYLQPFAKTGGWSF
jgi:hypothetical protein